MICSFEDCGRNHYAFGVCDGHYKQLKRDEPLRPLRARRKGKACEYVLAELLSWTRQEGECLVWVRADNSQGYGIAFHGGKNWMAHRLSFHLATGTEIGRQVIHHTCANSMCINPEHLQLAHQADNNLEMLSRRSLEARIADLEERVEMLEVELKKARSGKVVAIR